MRRGLRYSGLVAFLLTSAWGCASAPPRPPDGPGEPAPDAASALDAATSACRHARTFSADIRVAGRAGGTKVRGRILAGVERPSRLRIEGLAPFGPPAFILATRDARTLFLLPRDRRVVRDASVEDVLEALVGVRRTVDDLAALLSGCAVSEPVAARGERRGPDWIVLTAAPDVTAWLRRRAGQWQLVRAQHRAFESGVEWTVDYSEFASSFPSAIRLRERGPAGGAPAADTDLTFILSQREVNVPIDPAAFDVVLPAGVVPMSLDELRRAGPLADRNPTMEHR